MAPDERRSLQELAEQLRTLPGADVRGLRQQLAAMPRLPLTLPDQLQAQRAIDQLTRASIQKDQRSRRDALAVLKNLAEAIGRR